MQQLDAITIRQLAIELGRDLEASKLNKVQQPTGYEFLFGFWGGMNRHVSQKFKLYVSLNPVSPVCMLLSTKNIQELVLPTLPNPTGFCMLLRKHLSGATVLKIESLPGERVINLVFENFNELGNKVRLILSLELMGKQSNMVLIDDVQGSILGAAHLVTSEMSRYREVATGLPYEAPPKPTGKMVLSQLNPDDLFKIMEEKWPQGAKAVLAWLSHTLWGFNDRLLAQLVQKSNSAQELTGLLHGIEAGTLLTPCISSDYKRFSWLPPSVSEPVNPQDSFQQMVYRYFFYHLRHDRTETLRRSLLGVLESQVRRLQQRQQETAPIDESEVETFQRYGDLLLTAVSMGEAASINLQGDCVILEDFETGRPVEIFMDPALSLMKNAKRYYQKAKKARARQVVYETQRQAWEETLAYWGELKQLVLQADNLTDLLALKEDLMAAGLLREKTRGKTREKKPVSGRTQEAKQEMSGVFQTQSSEGFPLWVGKSGQANGHLVGKWGKPDDLWLHVHQIPGSHVLIKTEKRSVPNQTLLEAANLAVYYSAARESKNVPVLYTPIRHVRKIPNSYPGHVTYRQEQTVFITPEATILQSLSVPLELQPA